MVCHGCCVDACVEFSFVESFVVSFSFDEVGHVVYPKFMVPFAMSMSSHPMSTSMMPTASRM